MVLSLLSPLHPMGELLFAAHMAQHELMMVVAAPLLILGRPMVAWLWAIPIDARRWCGRVAGAIGGFWGMFSKPFPAFMIHLAAIWLWHVPRLYDASVTNDVVHSLQHASFLFSALLFWWSAIRRNAWVQECSMCSRRRYTPPS